MTPRRSDTETRAVVAAAIAVATTAFALPARSAEWPQQPIRIVVPFSTGGGTDIQARLLADSFHRRTKQNFIVDNRPGASGLIGTQLTVEAPPDGNMILFTTATLAINPTLYGKRWTVQPLRDLAPVSWITSAPLVLITHPAVPARSVRDLVALGKKQPGLLNGGINTPGSTSHLAAEMFRETTKIDTTLVPFKGGGPAVAAVVSGEIDYLFATGPSAAPHIRSKRVRALAVTTAKPSSAFPDLPTVNTFVPGLEADNWYAMFFRAGTPQHIVEKLNAVIHKALKEPKVRAFMAREALDPVGSTPEELRAHLQREVAKYAGVIDRADVRLQ